MKEYSSELVSRYVLCKVIATGQRCRIFMSRKMVLGEKLTFCRRTYFFTEQDRTSIGDFLSYINSDGDNKNI